MHEEDLAMHAWLAEAKKSGVLEREEEERRKRRALREEEVGEARRFQQELEERKERVRLKMLAKQQEEEKERAAAAAAAESEPADVSEDLSVNATGNELSLSVAGGAESDLSMGSYGSGEDSNFSAPDAEDDDSGGFF
jgi:hypothetical protein